VSGGKVSQVQKSVQTFNQRIPASLKREQVGLAKTLRKERFQKEPFKALESLYDLLDRVYTHANGLIACKKGCSYCCHMQVIVTQMEADFIAVRSGVAAKRLAISGNPQAESWISSSRPCPFLRENQCSIYAYRPVNCRTHVSFEQDAQKCGFDSTSNILMIDREASLPGAMQAYREMALRYGGHSADIRDFFEKSSVFLFK
jgi:Fe-S-cluster containining protein